MNIADMHCDTIEKLYHGSAEGLASNQLHICPEGLAKGEYLLQNFAVYVDLNRKEDPLEAALNMIDLYYQELAKARNILAPVRSFQDIVDNRAAGKISAMLTLEEGAVLKGSISNLRNLYRLGVRMMTLTWNYENELGAPNLLFDQKGNPLFGERNHKGLTPFGIQALEEMERLGIIPDVSHLSDGGFKDVLRHTTKPFVASHSNAAAVCGICRNLTDDMIRAIGERGGVIGINFCEDFLTESRIRTPESLRDAVLLHIRHIVKTGGIGVCALGSDFDGIPGNLWMRDASSLPMLVELLEQSGFTPGEVEQICYKNVMRVYQEVL